MGEKLSYQPIQDFRTTAEGVARRRKRVIQYVLMILAALAIVAVNLAKALKI